VEPRATHGEHCRTKFEHVKFTAVFELVSSTSLTIQAISFNMVSPKLCVCVKSVTFCFGLDYFLLLSERQVSTLYLLT